MEYEEMDMEEEEHKVRKLTKEELKMYQQYKEFYMIQGRAKGRCPVLVTSIDLRLKNTTLECCLT